MSRHGNRAIRSGRPLAPAGRAVSLVGAQPGIAEALFDMLLVSTLLRVLMLFAPNSPHAVNVLTIVRTSRSSYLDRMEWKKTIGSAPTFRSAFGPVGVYCFAGPLRDTLASFTKSSPYTS